ncbi:O-antigen ligase family protein [Microbacter sp. GSS18]|nr:O-antigen ligase family protein [Microbacter sp. GSS18]
MSDTGRTRPWAAQVLDSPSFARAYTYTVLGAVFASYLIERLTSRVTYATIIAGLCLLGIGVLISRRREVSLLRLVPTSLAIFIAWTFASIFWSTDSRLSAASWISTVAIALLAVVIGHVRDTLQTVRALSDVLRVMLGVSLGVEILSGILLDTPLLFLGVRGDIADLGPIQGIFGTRNMLGFVAVLAIITFLIEYRMQSVRTGVSLASVVLAGSLAVLSDSPTVLVVAVGVGTALGALWLVRHTPERRRSAVQTALGGLVVISLLLGYLTRHAIIAFINAGRDISMRVDLWNAMVDLVRLRPIQGWGWYGPWAPRELPFNLLNYRLDADHATGLNAWFDVLLQTGWIGLLIFIAFAVTALVRAWLDASARRSVLYAWTPLMMVALLVDSVFESFTLAGLGWLMLVLLAVRAGQSRSWRRRIDSSPVDPPGLEAEN